MSNATVLPGGNPSATGTPQIQAQAQGLGHTSTYSQFQASTTNVTMPQHHQHHAPLLSRQDVPVPTEPAADRDLLNGIDGGYPLTKTGRKKRGCDDDQDENDNYAMDPPEDSKHPYKNRSYHIRRAFSLFGDIHAIMNDGIKRRAREASGIYVDMDGIQQPRDYETFNFIVSHLDGLDQDILRLKRKPKVFRKLVRGIREAADQGRNNDTANLKRDIACMLTEDGSCVLNALRRGVRSSSKSDRGFGNDVMGRYLCPITLDWDDPHVRQDIRDGKYAIKASKVPRLLYANCECDVDDLELGLGRNQALLRVVKYIFTGRSSAFSPTPGGKTTRSGNAALAGMKEITPRVVAYSACMLRFAISTEESWSKVDNEFNMEEFYWYVVDIFDDAQEFGRNLLAWWNMQVFGTSAETTTAEISTDDTDFIRLLKQQRAAKRARILGNTTNVFDNSTAQRAGTPTVTMPESPSLYRSPHAQKSVFNSNPASGEWRDRSVDTNASGLSQFASQPSFEGTGTSPVTRPPSTLSYPAASHSIRLVTPLHSQANSFSNSVSYYATDPRSIRPASTTGTPSTLESESSLVQNRVNPEHHLHSALPFLQNTHNMPSVMSSAPASTASFSTAATAPPMSTFPAPSHSGRVVASAAFENVANGHDGPGNTVVPGLEALIRAAQL